MRHLKRKPLCPYRKNRPKVPEIKYRTKAKTPNPTSPNKPAATTTMPTGRCQSEAQGRIRKLARPTFKISLIVRRAYSSWKVRWARKALNRRSRIREDRTRSSGIRRCWCRRRVQARKSCWVSSRQESWLECLISMWKHQIWSISNPAMQQTSTMTRIWSRHLTSSERKKCTSNTSKTFNETSTRWKVHLRPTG